MFRGHDLMEDLKTLKELNIQADTTITFMVSLKTTSELTDKMISDEYNQENEEMI